MCICFKLAYNCVMMCLWNILLVLLYWVSSTVEGRAAAAAVSLRAKGPALASYGWANSGSASTGWIYGALALPAAGLDYVFLFYSLLVSSSLCMSFICFYSCNMLAVDSWNARCTLSLPQSFDLMITVEQFCTYIYCLTFVFFRFGSFLLLHGEDKNILMAYMTKCRGK